MTRKGWFKSVLEALLLAALVIGGSMVHAEERYPSKPIQMIVPTATGTATDIVARAIAQRLGEKLGQAVVVLNRQGAGGTIATNALVQAPADGYTIMMTNQSHSINPFVYSKLPFDTLKDTRGVAMVGEAPMAIVVAKALGVNTVKDFVEYAKRHPGAVNYGSAGPGSATHLAGATFATLNGLQLTHIPYKGASELLADLMTNRIQAVLAPVAFTLPAIRSGKTVALAVTSRSRMESPVKLGTLADEGLVEFEFGQWFGIITPAAVPDGIVDEIAVAVRALKDDENVRRTMEEQGIQARCVITREFDSFIKSDMDRLGRAVVAAGIKPN